MWTERKIRDLLKTSDRAVERALLVLHDRQTRVEQQRDTTIVHNDIGFTPYDAPRLTRWARTIRRGGHLSVHQLWWIRQPTSRFESRIAKYAGQLLDEAKRKERANAQRHTEATADPLPAVD